MSARRSHVSLRSLVRDTRGVAAVEFALILPLLLLLYLGSIEAAQLYVTDGRVATIAGTVADLVARSKTGVKGTDLQNYFAAASNVLTPGEVTNLSQVVSLVSIDEDGVATVEWSDHSGPGEGRNEGDEFPLDPTTKISELARNADGFLVVGEAAFPYVPITGLGITQTVHLRHVEYFLPRREGGINYDPDS